MTPMPTYRHPSRGKHTTTILIIAGLLLVLCLYLFWPAHQVAGVGIAHR